MINKKISWLKLINIKILISFLRGWRAFDLLTTCWCSLRLGCFLCALWSLRWYLGWLLRNRCRWLFAGSWSCRFYLNCITSFAWCNTFFMLRNLWIFAIRWLLWHFFNLYLRNLTFASCWRFWWRWLNLNWLVLTVILRLLLFRLFHFWVLIDVLNFLGYFFLFFFSLDRCSFYFSGNSRRGRHLIIIFLIFFLRIVFFLRFTSFFSWSFNIVRVLFYSLWMLGCWRFGIALILRLRLNRAIVYFFKVLVKVLTKHLRLFYWDF